MFSAKAKKSSLITSGISILDDGIAFALVSHEQDTPAVLHAEFIACSTAQYQETLVKLAKQHSLESHPCNFALQPSDYQILQVEKPDVASNELAAALKWRIKDLIDFPVDDAVIEILLPSIPNSNSNTAEVVISKASTIQRHVDLLNSAHINLVSIDISELAARNISFHSTPQLSSFALLNLWDDYARISIYLNNDLYLSRSSSIGLKTLDHISEQELSSLSILDSLALELQRTYDYYESHSRQAPIAELFILKNGHSDSDFSEQLQQHTGVNTQAVDVSLLTTNKDLTINPKCMTALGAALRNEFD